MPLTTLHTSLADDIAATAALASHLNTIDPEYGVHDSTLVNAGYRRAHKLQFCQLVEVPTVPKALF